MRGHVRRAGGGVVILVAPLPFAPSQHRVPTYTQTLSLVTASAALARMSTRTALRCWSLDELAGDAELIVSELVTNAVRHARPPVPSWDEPGRCRLTLQQPEPDTVRVWVTDASPHRVVRRTPGDEAEDGRGLDVVDALAAAWDVLPVKGGGKAVWAELKTSNSRSSTGSRRPSKQPPRRRADAARDGRHSEGTTGRAAVLHPPGRDHSTVRYHRRHGEGATRACMI
ncbi:ATP-binding protein [Streptomyces sp. ISL-14]|nr:ATP-binding protein [Streptomyces sp. ISL-14]